MTTCFPAQFCLFRSPHSGNVEKRDVFKKDWSKFDQEKFILDYREIDWNATFGVSDNPDQCFDVFNSKLKVLLFHDYFSLFHFIQTFNQPVLKVQRQIMHLKSAPEVYIWLIDN